MILEKLAVDRSNEATETQPDSVDSRLDDRSIQAEVPLAFPPTAHRRPRHDSGLHATDIPTETPTGSATPAGHPSEIGPYRVLDVLGEGGMGRVYLAEQTEPVHRHVAVKVLRFSLASDSLQARFDAERHAMVRVDHPNIGKLLEAGTTRQGQPYFAMEYIHGEPITVYCERHKQSIEDRLRIFAAACRGTAHAHNRLVLHRDLKPGNILVTEVDGEPFPKIIDFGIAKGLDGSLVPDAFATQGGFVGTPTYMSPEALGLGGEVDTRSDVFSLGVTLYKLLTGSLPWSGAEDSSPAVALKERLARKAKRPSTQLATESSARIERAARRRRLSPADLRRRLLGDLDAIVMKAIANNPDERYPSAAALADDIERYLRNEPISARRPTATYLIRKLLQRNRTAFLAAVAALVAVVLGIAGTTFGLMRANRQAQAARQALEETQEVSDLLVDLFNIANPERRDDQPANIREVLDRGIEKVRLELGEQPLVRARFLLTIGAIFTRMAELEKADDVISEALAIRESELGEDHLDTLESANQLGITRRRQGRYDEAETLLSRVVEAYESNSEASSSELAAALNDLGNAYWSQEKWQDAETTYRRSLELREALADRDDEDIAQSLNNLGALLQARKRFAEAEPILLRAADAFALSVGEGNPSYAASLLNLAMVQVPIGNWDDAEEHFRQALSIFRASYGLDHPRTLRAHSQLRSLLRRSGRHQEVVDMVDSLIRELGDDLALDNPRFTPHLNGLAISQAHLGELDLAEENFRLALSLTSAHYGEESRRTQTARANLGWLEARRGQHAEAEEIFRRLLALMEVQEPRSLLTGWVQQQHARSLAALGRPQAAEAAFTKALESQIDSGGAHHYGVGEILHELGSLVGQQGRRDEALVFLRRALEVRTTALPADHFELQETRDAIARLLPRP